MARFELSTRWQLAAPIETVWNAIYTVEAWPQWWPYVQRVSELCKADAQGAGVVRRYTWSSRLPCSLSFDMRVTCAQRPHLLESEALAELTGSAVGL